MSAVIREIYWQEYDTTTKIRTVRADIICDAIADLPSGGIMTDYKLDIGSRAKVIADGSEWEIQSSGSWVRQPSKLQLDLTGYATESWVNGELAGYVPTTTYNTDQAAQDAAIASKVSIVDLYPPDRRTTDISTTTDPGIYRFYARNGTANLPTDITTTSPFGLLQVLKTSTYVAQILIHFVPANPPDVYIRRSSDSGSSWTVWLKLQGTTVA